MLQKMTKIFEPWNDSNNERMLNILNQWNDLIETNTFPSAPFSGCSSQLVGKVLFLLQFSPVQKHVVSFLSNIQFHI